jgi:hypothetical protein
MEKNRYRTLREIMEDMRAAGEDLDNCDEELLAVHAAFAMLLKRDADIAKQTALLPEVIDQFEAALKTRSWSHSSTERLRSSSPTRAASSARSTVG